jgi:hypothetical protein
MQTLQNGKKLNAIKTFRGKWNCYFSHSYCRHKLEVRGQPHFLAVLLLGEGRLYPLNGSLDVSQNLCGRFGAEKIVLTWQGRQNERSYASTLAV